MTVPERIKFLSLKWKKGTLSEAERSELSLWYNQSMPESLEITGSDEQHVKNTLFNKIKKELVTDKQPQVKIVPLWLKVAASVIFVLGLSLLYRQFFYSSSVIAPKQLVVTTHSIKRIILPDSSIVWVKGNSKLIYPATFGTRTREVSLIGEALFEIKHDSKHPFVVKSGRYETTVLGTSFNLKCDMAGNAFDLAVLTGKVGVLKRVKGEEAKVTFVTANQTLKVVAGMPEKVLLHDKNIVRPLVTAGTQYNMTFERTPFEEIMLRFEQKFNVQFEGYTGEYKSCKVTADLTDQSMEQSLKVLCSSINATYKVKDNKIQLTGGGCFDE